MPHGFRPEDGTPLSITFLGQLFGEEKLLKLGQAFQRVTTHHQKHPALG
jgi:Asp-tRNA(Asn)/Glu-tRNA(Gln) amidotransferase A subunit family amidase